MSEAASSIMVQSWPQGSQIAVDILIFWHYDFLINFSAVASLCRAYFKYDNNKFRNYLSRCTLVGHIIFLKRFVDNSWTVFETSFDVLPELHLMINSSIPIPNQPSLLQTKFTYEQMAG